MSGTSATRQAKPRSDADDGNNAAAVAKEPLFDLSGIDLNSRRYSRAQLERWNPHRGVMALLDYLVWESEDHTRGVALWQVRDDEFWVPGHFPSRPLLPGVLQIEAGAQLAVYLYNARMPEPRLAAFTRIDRAVFRAAVEPGDDFYLLCREFRFQPKRFISDIQGMVGGKIAYEARISGIAISETGDAR